MNGYSIRAMTAADWPQVAKIYADGIATGIATFEHTVPTHTEWDSAHLKTCRLVAEESGSVLGWVALSPVSSRCVYGGVAEVSVYINEKSRGKGIGRALMLRLIQNSEQAGYWTLQSGIFPDNKASIALHEKVGFRYIGRREKLGKTVHGIWTDNLLFERRSTTIGT